MSKMLPGAAVCSGGFVAALTAAGCNWSVADVTHIFETFIAMLGISAAIWGAGSSVSARAKPASMPRCAGAAG